MNSNSWVIWYCVVALAILSLWLAPRKYWVLHCLSRYKARKQKICRYAGSHPDEWLVILPGNQAFEVERELRANMDGHYAIVNVSGGQTVLTLSGIDAVKVLKKSTPYDVHDCNFPVGKVVTTVFAKTQAVIRRTGEKNWELVVRRSFADYTWLWLQDACKEYGLVIKD